MTVLSAQSIRDRCVYHGERADEWMPLDRPLISPFVFGGTVNGRSYGLSACTYDCRISDGLIVPVGQFRLASTMERFIFPNDVCGSVLDKSTWARVGVSAFNTHFDPGFEGYATIELINLGTEAAIFEPGDPLIQMRFELLDQPTELPYQGKYSQQEPGPQKARYR